MFFLENPLSGHICNLSPIKMSKNKINYFDIIFQTVSGERKWLVCFTNRHYDLFRKINESQKEGIIIKKPCIQNDNILITDYTKVSISAIMQCMIKDSNIANIAAVLGEAILRNIFNIQAISDVSDIDNYEGDGT